MSAEDDIADLLDEYVEALQSGTATDPRSFLEAHPEAPEGTEEELALVASLHNAACSVTQDLGDVDEEALLERGSLVPPPAQLLKRDQRLGECVVEELIGYGGMGEVYRARHEALGRDVAIKILRSHLASDPAAVSRFRKEVRSQARMSPHQNVVAAMHASDRDGLVYLVMEYVDGTDLAALVHDEGRLAVDVACRYVRQAAEGLAHAHAHGLVHRDIKPSNLLRTESGTIKLVDLGLARLASHEAGASVSLAISDELVGSLDYMAPEQADAPDRADARSDLYALGCTLYFLIAGRPPFADRLMLKKLMAHAVEKPEPLSSLRDDVPEAVDRIVGRLLEKKPEDRYGSAQELVDDLVSAGYGAGRAADASQRLPAPDPPKRAASDGTNWAVPAGIALVVGATLGALAVHAAIGDPPPVVDPEPEPEPAPTLPILEVGEMVEGSLEDGDDQRPGSMAYVDRFSVRVEDGHTYVFTMRSQELDAHLFLRDSRGFLIGENDDYAGEGTHAELVHRATESGALELLAGSHTGGRTGRYTLTMAEEELPELRLAEEVADALGEGDARLAVDQSWVDRYWLPVVAGAAIRIQMDAEGFRPYLRIEDREGTPLLRGRVGHTRSVLLYVPTNDATVYVAANAFEPGAGGTYRLVASPPSVGTDVVLSHDGELAAGDVLMDDKLTDIHELELEAGMTYSIAVRGVFDTVLRVEDRDGELIADNDDAGGLYGTSSRVLVELVETAPVRIAVTSYSAGASGAYRLEVLR